MKAYGILKSANDNMQVQPILQMLKNLYIYPTRGRHNELIGELHELKEILDDLVVKEEEESKITKTLKGLGAFDIQMLPIPVWVAIGALAAHIYKSQSKKE